MWIKYNVCATALRVAKDTNGYVINSSYSDNAMFIIGAFNGLDCAAAQRRIHFDYYQMDGGTTAQDCRIHRHQKARAYYLHPIML